MQPGSAGIYRNRYPVFQKCNLHGILGSGFLKLLNTGIFTQTLHHRFFGNALTAGHTVERGFDGASGHREFPVRRDQLLPGNALYLLKKFFEGFRRELSHFQQDPIRAAEPQVAAHDRPFISQVCDFSVFCLYESVSQLLYFPFYHRLQPEGGSRNQFQLQI